MEINKIIANNIRQFRKSLGFTQEEVADYISIDVSVYNRIENAKILPSQDKLYLLSKLFRIPIEKFFEGLGSNVQNNYDNSQVNSNVQINLNNKEDVLINEFKLLKTSIEELIELFKKKL